VCFPSSFRRWKTTLFDPNNRLKVANARVTTTAVTSVLNSFRRFVSFHPVRPKRFRRPIFFRSVFHQHEMITTSTFVVRPTVRSGPLWSLFVTTRWVPRHTISLAQQIVDQMTWSLNGRNTRARLKIKYGCRLDRLDVTPDEIVTSDPERI